MEFDAAATKLINSLAGKSATLDLLMVLVAKWGVFLLIAVIALRWWSIHDRELARYAAICCGLATALGLFMMLIETHTHLDFPEFAEDLDHVLLRAKQASVERIITIGTTNRGNVRHCLVL